MLFRSAIAPGAPQVRLRVSTIERLPGRAEPIDSQVTRPIMSAPPRVVALKWRKSAGDSNIPKDIKTLEYTMIDDDYKTVANNSTNKGLAKADGKEAELKQIETQKAFNAIITAEKYAPALIAFKFSTLDEGSAVRLTYNYKNVASTPLYIDTLSYAGWYNPNKNES